MQERVSTIIGKQPVILIAPHGADDTNTGIIAEEAAKLLECFAVINRGFDRANSVDVDNDLADCNRIDHIKQDVIYDEYLKPIKRFVNKISLKYSNLRWPYYGYTIETCHIFHIHGCGNNVHKEAQCQINLILGYGLGSKKHNLTCEEWRKNAMLATFRKHAINGEVFSGKGGGRYAGRDSNNMNQYYRKHEEMHNIQSVQLEFPYSTRNTDNDARDTGLYLANSIREYITYNDYKNSESEYFI